LAIRNGLILKHLEKRMCRRRKRLTGYFDTEQVDVEWRIDKAADNKISFREFPPTHMPKFLRIGIHQSNVSGYTSKAWWVRRVGSTVVLKGGAVEVHGVADQRKIYWTLPPEAKTIRCGTVQRAKDYSKAAIARRRNHRYEPLAGSIAIRRRPASRGAELEPALATILFVDIVKSIEKAARLGDSRWTQVMNQYYAAVRGELKTLRGKEVVTTGDGLLATFDAPASGVRCATAIREAVRTLGLEIRVGLHAGESHIDCSCVRKARREPG
jgi:hypothetical protein